MSVKRFVLPLLLVAIGFAACRGDEAAPAAPTATAPGASVATPTATAARAEGPGPSPTASPAVGRRLSDSTGVADVDAVLAVLASGDAARVRALFEEVPSPCVVNPQGIHDPPACPDGVAAGTLIPVPRALAGEAVWPNDLERVLGNWLQQPHSVFAVVRPGAAPSDWLTRGDYAVVFDYTAMAGWSSVMNVSGGSITSFAFGSNRPPAMRLAELEPVQVIVPPP